MAKASFPVSSTRAFAIFFEKAFIASGAALVELVKPAAVSNSAASFSLPNTTTRKYFQTSNSAQTFTVNKDLDKIKIGDEITIVVNGTGLTTVVAGTDVTINKLAATLKSNGRYSVIRLIKTAANVYVATGDLAAS